MNKLGQNILQWLIHSNIFIAIAAVSFLYANVLLLHLEDSVPWVIYLHVASSTWCVYQLSRWVYHRRLPIMPIKDDIYRWIDKNRLFMKISIVVSAITAFVSFLFIHIHAQLLVVGVGLISVLYPLDIKYKQKSYRLRDLPLIKIGLIATVWSASTVLLPSVYQYIATKQIFLFMLQWLFIFIITIPFDINDMITDKANSLKTFPIVLGIKRTISLEIVLSILYLIGLFFFFMSDTYGILKFQKLSIFIGMSILIIFLLFFTAKKSFKVNKWIIMAVYDGSMIIYAAILFFILKLM